MADAVESNLDHVDHLINANNFDELRKILENNDGWQNWRFTKKIDVSFWTKNLESEIALADLSILHLAIIEQRYQCARTILDVAIAQSEDLTDFIHHKIQVEDDMKAEDFLWMIDAKAVHLSAMFDEKTLADLVRMYPDLKDDQDNRTEFSPLHVAAMQRKATFTR